MIKENWLKDKIDLKKKYYLNFECFTYHLKYYLLYFS